MTRALALLTAAARGVGVARAETLALAREAITRGLRGDLALVVLDAAAAAVAEDEATLARAGVELAAALVAAAATAVGTRAE